MSEIPRAAVERGAKASSDWEENRLSKDRVRAVLTAAHDELIQAWVRSRLDDPETVERVAKALQAFAWRIMGRAEPDWDGPIGPEWIDHAEDLLALVFAGAEPEEAEE